MQENGQRVDETAVRFERVLSGSIERVWNHLTASEHLAHWLIPGTIEPRPGGLVDLGNGHIRGIVTQWKPRQKLIYSWNVFSPGETESRFPESHVLWELKPRAGVEKGDRHLAADEELLTKSSGRSEPVPFFNRPRGDAVLLTLTHRPMLEEFTPQTLMGWHTFLEMLAAVLNGDQPEPRETLMERNRNRYGVTEIKR
jgi:uncharacterized protein YndB with AHSA1/START domain